MKKVNRFLKPLLALGLIAAISSCNSNSSTKNDVPANTADTTSSSSSVAPTPPAAPEFQPFTVAEITHTVKDYAKWRPIFDADSNNRKANGLETIVVGREIDHPNNIMTAYTVSDMQKAKDFGNSPSLKEKMKAAGVISKPDLEFFKVIRFNPNSHEKQWVVITHKVKDFDAWLKVFDAEGSAKRASDGLVDVVLARGVEDSNLVHIVFDITDMAKAKASMNSADKKKLMMSAGVEGTPKIEYFNTAE
ncbi:MAG TPA: hypothetical protein VFI29_17015 [Hanamia sp.]|nr:hypothetical protein [Hanamia sp.]